MKLEPLIIVQVTTQPLEVGAGPKGPTVVSIATGGNFKGARLLGSVLRGEGEWFLTDVEEVWRMDVALRLETDDGAEIDLTYRGILVMNDEVKARTANGGSMNFGDTYFMTQPRFQTTDPRYLWLTRIVTVAQGRILQGMVEYEIFEVTHG